MPTFAFALALLCQATPAGRDPAALLRAEADSGFTGVVVVAHGDSLVFHGAFGRTRWRRLSTSSRFDIGSMTKGFTAAAILALREQSKLALEDSIGRFLEGVPPDKRGITIAELIRHTSGLEDRGAAAGTRTRGAAVRAILAAPLAHAPGTYYQYMNEDYVLLAAIVEIASGTTWERYVTRMFLQPLGLEHTGFRGGDWAQRGASGMVSSATDLLRWVRAIESGSVVNRTMSAELRRPLLLVRQQPPYDVFAGYGTRVYVRDRRVVELFHSGAGDSGHSAAVRVLENGDIIVALSNAGRRGNVPWASYVATGLQPR